MSNIILKILTMINYTNIWTFSQLWFYPVQFLILPYQLQVILFSDYLVPTDSINDSLWQLIMYLFLLLIRSWHLECIINSLRKGTDETEVLWTSKTCSSYVTTLWYFISRLRTFLKHLYATVLMQIRHIANQKYVVRTAHIWKWWLP